MAVELSYVVISPYSLIKARTGVILARLLSRTDLELIGAQILAFTPEQTQAYAALLRQEKSKNSEMLADYVLENFTPTGEGKNKRFLLVLFKGEDACRKIAGIVGGIPYQAPHSLMNGDTIRATYADLIEDRDNPAVIRYFEPAVLAPEDWNRAVPALKLFAEVASQSPNIIANTVGSAPDDEQTLVIIKPDNWRYPSSRPGNIIDMLSRTGLRIVGCKLYRMSIAEALEFYGPVQQALQEKLAPKIGDRARQLLEQELHCPLDNGVLEQLTASVGMRYADYEFGSLIEFMSGRRPEDCPEAERNEPGLVKWLLLINEGKDAIQRIPRVLGPPDPGTAPGGTVRRDFGSNVMVNTAHASDSPESVRREERIIKINRNHLAAKIDEFLAAN